MKHLSNLPPGCTQREIDRQVEDEDDLCWECGGNRDFCECEPEEPEPEYEVVGESSIADFFARYGRKS